MVPARLPRPTVRSMASESEPVEFTSTDEQLAQMVAVADLPALLATLAHDCSARELLEATLYLDPTKHHEPHGGWTPDQQAHARELALDALADLRDAGWPAVPKPTPESVRPIIRWMTTTETSDDYIALLLEELGGEDLRAPSWDATAIAPERPFRVAVVGAGMCGLLAAYRLRQAGIEVVVFEKNSDVGGKWLETTYPGCRVDVASHLFCYSFAQRSDWPQHFSDQPELLAYFQRFADESGVRAFIRFETTVESVEFDDDATAWQVSTVSADGEVGFESFDAVINATGQLNRPKFPDILGRDSFAGPSFHSA